MIVFSYLLKLWLIFLKFLVVLHLGVRIFFTVGVPCPAAPQFSFLRNYKIDNFLSNNMSLCVIL